MMLFDGGYDVHKLHCINSNVAHNIVKALASVCEWTTDSDSSFKGTLECNALVWLLAGQMSVNEKSQLDFNNRRFF